MWQSCSQSPVSRLNVRYTGCPMSSVWTGDNGEPWHPTALMHKLRLIFCLFTRALHHGLRCPNVTPTPLWHRHHTSVSSCWLPGPSVTLTPYWDTSVSCCWLPGPSVTPTPYRDRSVSSCWLPGLKRLRGGGRRGSTTITPGPPGISGTRVGGGCRWTHAYPRYRFTVSFQFLCVIFSLNNELFVSLLRWLWLSCNLPLTSLLMYLFCLLAQLWWKKFLFCQYSSTHGSNKCIRKKFKCFPSWLSTTIFQCFKKSYFNAIWACKGL